MTLLPKVKLKAMVNFPATVLDGTGIDVVKSNGSYQFDLDFSDFAPPVGSVSDAANQNALLWNSVTGSYTLAPMALLAGGSLPDAPNDGLQYGRQSLGWTQIVVPAIPTPSASLPVMNGTATPGAAAAYSRGDHVHPTDTSITASTLSFIQAGVGANTRTMLDKAREIFSVKDFGAVGNGVADDTAPIQEALTAAGAAGGGTVFMPPGTYKTTSRLSMLYSGVYLEGAGLQATRIAPNFTSDHIINIGAASSTLLGNAVRNMTIQPTVTSLLGAAINIEGNNIITNIDHMLISDCFDGIILDSHGAGSYYLIDDCYIGNCSHTGIVLGTTSGVAQGVHISRCQIGLCDVGISCVFVSGFYLESIDILQCRVSVDFAPPAACYAVFGFFNTVLGDRPTEIAFLVAGTPGIVAGITCVNCWAGGALGNAGIHLNSAALDGFIWTQGQIRSNDKMGVYIGNGKNVTFSENHIFHNSLAGSNLYPGVAIDAGASDITINDNKIGYGGWDALDGHPNWQSYGIYIVAGAAQLLIHGNNLRGNVAGGIIDNTTGFRIITNNIGYVTEAHGVATILSGTPSLSVNHGLSGTPTTINCTPRHSGAQAIGANIPRVSAVSSSAFTYDIGVNASANRDFSWEAKL